MFHRFLVFLMLVSFLAACSPRQTPQNTPEHMPEVTYPGPTQAPVLPSPPVGSPAPGGTPPDSPVSPGGLPGGDPDPLPFVTQPGDEKLERGNVFIDSAQILTLESFPPQFMLSLEGSLPTPCHQLKAKVNPPDSRNRIAVEVYSLVDPEMVCIQVLEPFTENVPLGSLPAGNYMVMVNGEEAGEITAP